MIVRIVNLPPMPRNRSHQVARDMMIKTKLCREFEKDLEQRLKEYERDFLYFKGVGIPNGFISAVYTIYTPIGLLYTKEDKISARAVDTDAHKVMRDTLYRCMGIDDKMERDTRFFTPASPDENWHYEIELHWRLKCHLLPATPSWILNTTEQLSETSDSSAAHLL